MKTIIAKVREHARDVLKESSNILTIDTKAIDTNLIPRLEELDRMWDKLPFTRGHRMFDQDLGLVVYYNVMNFCFQDPKTRHEYTYTTQAGKKQTRSTAFFTALAEAPVDWNDPKAVRRISLDRWMKMTQQSEKNVLYLGKERLEKAIGFSNFLIEKGYPSVVAFVEADQRDAQNLIYVFIESGYYEDEFLKRAQLTLRSIDEIMTAHKHLHLKRIDLLTCMADYRLPQVFYNTGVVKLSDELKKKLKNQEEIIAGSPEEKALRATVIVVGEYIAKAMHTTESNIDRLLWELSQEMAHDGELPIPHMLVATDKY